MTSVPIIWIASYPRSGNTYLRTLLVNYLRNADHPVLINDLPYYATGEHNETVWEMVTGLKARERSLEVEWRGRTQYHDLLRRKLQLRPLIVKTHTTNRVAFDAPAFEFQPGDKIIHLVRHPCDVAISAADFYGLPLDRSVDRLLRDGAYIDGRPATGFEVIGSWAEHTRSWMAEQRAPSLRLRLCDLIEEPAGALRRAAVFLGFGIDEDRIRSAVAYSSFAELRRQDNAHGFVEASPVALSGRFYRSGRPLQWIGQLPEDLANRIIAANQALLDDLGFTDYVGSRVERTGLRA